MTHLGAAMFFLCFHLNKATPIPAVHDGDVTRDQPSSGFNESQTRWSRQDVFTLISVCVGVAAILIGALIALPRLREWLCKPFHRKPNPYSTQHT
jgi:hypothetical protein